LLDPYDTLMARYLQGVKKTEM